MMHQRCDFAYQSFLVCENIPQNRAENSQAASLQCLENGETSTNHNSNWRGKEVQHGSCPHSKIQKGDYSCSSKYWYACRGLTFLLILGFVRSVASMQEHLKRSPPPEIGKIVVEIGVIFQRYTLGEESEIQEIFSKKCEKVNFPQRF